MCVCLAVIKNDSTEVFPVFNFKKSVLYSV